MIRLINSLYKLLSWHYCKLCGLPNAHLICKHCFKELERLPQPKCSKCLKPYSGIAATICSICNSQAYYYDKLYCKFSYAKPLNKILHDLKYKGRIEYAKVLGLLLFKNLGNKWHDYDLIIPMPLHKQRLALRGYNQVEELLKYSRACNLSINTQAAIRVKQTTSQTLITKHERTQNLADAFQLKHAVTGLKILVVDDVITTGATINELAKLLKQNGALVVDICCLMRAI